MATLISNVSLKATLGATLTNAVPTVGQEFGNSQTVTQVTERFLSVTGTPNLSSLGVDTNLNALRVRRMDTTSAVDVLFYAGSQVPYPMGVGSEFTWANGDGLFVLSIDSDWNFAISGGSADLYLMWAPT